MDASPAAVLRERMRNSHNVRVLTVHNAGHHIYADNPEAFHDVLVAHK